MLSPTTLSVISADLYPLLARCLTHTYKLLTRSLTKTFIHEQDSNHYPHDSIGNILPPCLCPTLHTLVRHIRQPIPPQRTSFPNTCRRTTLPSHPPPILATPYTAMQSPGHEHYMPLRILERPRTTNEPIRLLRQPRHTCLLQDCRKRRPLHHPPTRPLRMRRMGDGRTALVATQKEGHSPPTPRRLLPPTCQNIRARGRKPTRRYDHRQGRPYHNGPSRERIRLLRLRQTLHQRHQAYPTLLRIRQCHPLPMRLVLQLPHQRTRRPPMDTQLRHLGQSPRRVRSTKATPPQHPSDVQRILERMVRQMGRTSRDTPRQRYDLRHRGYAASQHQLLPLHDTRRHKLQPLGWRQRPRLPTRRHKLRLRRPNKRKRTTHP